jgi:hypothetical protein
MLPVKSIFFRLNLGNSDRKKIVGKWKLYCIVFLRVKQ